MPAGGWGGGGGGGMPPVGWNPMAGAGANALGGAGNITKALGIAKRRGGPAMAEGGQPPGGSAIPQEPNRAAIYKLLMDAGVDPGGGNVDRISQAGADPMQGMGAAPSPFHSRNPQMEREMTHRHPARSAEPAPEAKAMQFLRSMGEENPVSAPMGEWPYNRTGVTPHDPFGLRPDPNDPSLLAQMRTDPQMHRAMDRLLFMLTPGVGEEGTPASRAEEIIRLMMGAPNVTGMTYQGSNPDQAQFPLDSAQEQFEHKRKHSEGHNAEHAPQNVEHGKKSEHHESESAKKAEHDKNKSEGKVYVKEHWRGGRTARKRGGVVKKALSAAKRPRKVAGRK